MKIEIEDTELHKLVESIKLLTEEISKFRQQQPIQQVICNPPGYYVYPNYVSPASPYWIPNCMGATNLQTSNTTGY
jgi:tRNA1(Val) A37 N6-methylase TrmN6